jgi:hypothetical protein
MPNWTSNRIYIEGDHDACMQRDRLRDRMYEMGFSLKYACASPCAQIKIYALGTYTSLLAMSLIFAPANAVPFDSTDAPPVMPAPCIFCLMSSILACWS